MLKECVLSFIFNSTSLWRFYTKLTTVLLQRSYLKKKKKQQVRNIYGPKNRKFFFCPWRKFLRKQHKIGLVRGFFLLEWMITYTYIVLLRRLLSERNGTEQRPQSVKEDSKIPCSADTRLQIRKNSASPDNIQMHESYFCTSTKVSKKNSNRLIVLDYCSCVDTNEK